MTCTTNLDQSGPGSNDNEEVLHIPQSSRSGASPSDSLVSYPGHSLEEERGLYVQVQEHAIVFLNIVIMCNISIRSLKLFPLLSCHKSTLSI